jgi:hypothetical protein
MSTARRLGFGLSMLALAAVGAPTASAAVAPQRPEFVIAATTYIDVGLFHGPAISSNDAGEFVVVWEQLYGGYYGNPAGIFGRRFDALGRQIGAKFTVNGPTYQGSGRNSPAVASDPAGNFVVVWQEYPEAYGDGYGAGIVGRRFQGSVAQGPPFLVNALTANHETNPKVAADAAGNFVVVWTYYTGGSYNIKARRLDSSGTPLGGEFQVNTTTSCCPGANYVDEDPDGIEVAADPGGSFMVVWETGTGAGQILGRVFDGTGTPATAEFQVNAATTVRQTFPAIAADGAGHFLVSWQTDDGKVLVRRFSTAGAALGGELQANTTPAPSYITGGKIAAGSTGGFVVVWQKAYEVLGREFDSTGTPVGGEFQIQDTSAYAYAKRTPDVAGGTDGTFTVVWDGYNYSGNWQVVGRRLGPAPVPCAPAALAGCREPIVLGRGTLRYKTSANPARSTLLWRFARGQAASVDDFGDPFTTDSYAFCVYDASGAVLTAVVPAGGACGAVPCWREISGSRVDYFDPARFADGLSNVRLTPGADGAARALVKGKGTRLTLPTAPLTPPVTAQLQGANGECWSASYAGASILENSAGSFRAKPGA